MKHLIATLALLPLGLAHLNAHSHLAAGSNAGTLVLNDEGNSLLAATNPQVYHLIWSTGGTYSGTYSLDAAPRPVYETDFFTFIALEAESEFPPAAPLGAQIWIEMSLVSGPDGGTFSFWDAGDTAPSKTFFADGSSGNFSFILSEPATFGVPADLQDPYGHIHGRAFTASTAGDYLVSFRLFDASGLGAGGGPLIQDSPAYTFQFSAIPEPAPAALTLLGIGVWALLRQKNRFLPAHQPKPKQK